MAKKTYDENIEEFISQMKSVGVTEKTIKQVLKEIHEYQQKELEKQLLDMQKRMYQVLKEAYERDETI